MIREFQRSAVPGLIAVALLVAIAGVSIWGFIHAAQAVERGERALQVALWMGVLTAASICLAGFFTVAPNQGMVLQLFGEYKGTVRKMGLHWANPFLSKKRVSLRVRNFETAHLKVNDHDGNPVEIAAVVVWKVVDTAEAMFQVDNYENYVHVQSESALRNLATAYPYDSHEETITSLRGHTSTVADHLKQEIHDRLMVAGVEVVEARISHLAYAAEIAAVMLQRQQAAAIIAARTRIVEGAVGMVEMALERLDAHKMVDLDPDRRAAMVSNLLVVLCGERSVQPIVNTGTIYN
jgi:regulator of protease activity HflC (stomatin/prohibitin superfamily)